MRKFPCINTFYHEGPTVINAIRYLTVEIFEHLYITSKTDIDKRVNYTERILAGPALNNYREIFLVCKETENFYSGYQWDLVEAKDISMDNFGDWAKVVRTDAGGNPESGVERCDNL